MLARFALAFVRWHGREVLRLQALNARDQALHFAARLLWRATHRHA